MSWRVHIVVWIRRVKEDFDVSSAAAIKAE